MFEQYLQRGEAVEDVIAAARYEFAVLVSIALRVRGPGAICVLR